MTVVTAEEAQEAQLTSSDVAVLTGLSQSSILRVPREKLDYWETLGGPSGKRHRRYRRADVERFALLELGKRIAED